MYLVVTLGNFPGVSVMGVILDHQCVELDLDGLKGGLFQCFPDRYTHRYTQIYTQIR